jgi:hypothetical protein
MRVAPINTEVKCGFVVKDAAGAAVTGLTSADFTRRLSYDGTYTGDPDDITVEEDGGGVYFAVVTLDQLGVWHAYLSHATHNPEGWSEEIHVTTDGLPALDNLDATISSRASAADQATIIGHVDTLEAEVAALAAALAAIDVPTADENADALLDRINAIEDATVRQALTAIYDVLLAGASEGWQGGSAGTVVFKNKAGTVDRLTADVDQHGNRSNVVVDHS